VIEHTHKLPGWHAQVAPPELSGTVVRGELYGERGGKAIPSEELGGMLNATTWNSRQKQEETKSSVGAATNISYMPMVLIIIVLLLVALLLVRGGRKKEAMQAPPEAVSVNQ
jgi:hypothetical protein